MRLTRRLTNGVVVVTTAARAEYIRRCYRANDVTARVLAVQEGPAWPALRPPAVLDTIDLPIAMLIGLLANSPPAPIIALADPGVYRTLRLLALCPAVQLIVPDDVLLVRRWMRHLQGKAVAAPTSAGAQIWLLPAPPPLPCDPLLLPILAALPSSPSYTRAAARCMLSVSTLHRVLRMTRLALGLPSGALARFSPADLATLILERLGSEGSAISASDRGNAVLR